MSAQFTIAIIGVVSALVGTIIGGLASYLSTRSMKKLEWKLSQIESEIEKREKLYSTFLSESNKWIIQSFENKVNSLGPLSKLLDIESEIQLVSPLIGKLAREIASCVIDHHQVGKDASGKYPKLRVEFITKCRVELDSLRREI